MKSQLSLGIFGLCFYAAYGEQATPLGSIKQLLTNLIAQVERDGEEESKAYDKFAEWCDDTAANNMYAVDVATKQKAKLEALIEKLTSDIEIASTKIEELASSIAEADGESKKAKTIREMENAEFREGEKDLMDMVEALRRAANIIEKKGGAALAQVDTTNTNNVVQALNAMLEAASFSIADKGKLLALVQSKGGADDAEGDADAELGAPQAAAYESHGGNIMEIMEDMREDAENQLTKLRHAETEAKNNYDLVVQSLNNRLEVDNKDMASQKSDRSKASEQKATATGELQMTTKNLKDSSLELKTVRSTCLQTASDHEVAEASRQEELNALNKALEVLAENTKGVASFVQASSKATFRLSKSEVVKAVKRLAKQHHSAALAQLATRIASVLRSGASSGANPFGKVVPMIKDMIRKLDAQALAEAREKEYCDREMAKAREQGLILDDDVDGMTVTIDSAAARIAQLKEQIKQLQGELASLSKEQAQLDQVRSGQNAVYVKEKAEQEQALHGIRQALGVLRDYYGVGGSAAAMLQEDQDQDQDSDFDAFMQQPAQPNKHKKSQGAGSKLIEILELVESDFAEALAKTESQEADELSNYEKMTAENRVAKASKEEDLKFLEASLKGLDTTVTENLEDRDTSNSELSAVEAYLAKLKERCIAKPETFEERANKRKAEIDGLQEALTILNTESASFLQHHHSHRALRAHKVK